MLTARDGLEDRIGGLDAGADDYLTKPFAFAELLARLRALARRGTLERPAVLEVGDLRLDPATRRVWRGDAEVELSAKEFALLETFMRRPGRVLSRYDLLEHAWDYEYERRSNVVDVYVRYLREKVDRPFGRASLETVRGDGIPAALGRRRMSRLSLRLRLTLAFVARDGALACRRGHVPLSAARLGARRADRLGAANACGRRRRARSRGQRARRRWSRRERRELRAGARSRTARCATRRRASARRRCSGPDELDARPARRPSSSSEEARACSRRRWASWSSSPAHRSRTGTTRSPPCGRSSCSVARSCCCSPRSRATRSLLRRCDRCSRGSRQGSSASAASSPGEPRAADAALAAEGRARARAPSASQSRGAARRTRLCRRGDRPDDASPHRCGSVR